MKIFIDDREDGNVVSHFRYAAQRYNQKQKNIDENKTVEIEVTHLEAGDFVCGNVAIEHKCDDYLSSLFGGRLYKQIEQMQLNFATSCVMIDKNPGEVFGLHTSAMGGIVSCYVRNSPVLFCGTTFNMAEAAIKYFEKANDDKSRDINLSLNQKATKDVALNIISGIPGISEELGNAILDKFKSIEGVVKASLDELMTVDGISDKRARTIYIALHSPRW